MNLSQSILEALAQAGHPMSAPELAKALGLPRHLKARVASVLEDLVQEGKAAKNARHRYSPARPGTPAGKAPPKSMSGRFMMSSRGIAFVRVEGRKDDFMVPDRHRGWALPDDEVEIRPLVDSGRPPRRGRPAGRAGGREQGRRDLAEVLRVIRRGREQWVGRYRRQGGEHWVDVAIGELELELDLLPPTLKVEAGEWVVASAPSLADKSGEPGPSTLLSVLGGDGTPHLDTLIILKKAGLPEAFPREAVSQAQAFGTQIPAGAERGRLDLREKTVFTIDGADAKDFDDAVSLEREGDQWVLGVHIADVSRYVTPGSALDREALDRGTSTYLPDRVVPMLPEALSNGLCSLNQGVDRLTVSAVMRLDSRGALVSASFHNSVIRSARRCTYEEVQAFLDGGALDRDPQGSVAAALKPMEALALLRLKLRARRGALDFNFPETKCELDAQGRPTRLYRRGRIFAHQLIEEFMLAANESVAKALAGVGQDFLYRVHEAPDPEKLGTTLDILSRLKVGLKGMDRAHPAPRDLQKLLATVAGTPMERTAQSLLLRSLKLARYGPEADGHFGLALEHYCHFTSPIRRYPDLHVHRMVKKLLCGAGGDRRQETGEGKEAMTVAALGEQCSRLERRAEQVERDCVKAKQMRYLQERIGQSYAATVTSVGSFGYFAEIDEFPAEGLVRLGRLTDDLYRFDEDHWCLKGVNRGGQIRVGEKVKIVVESADWEILQADFAPAK